MNGRRIRMLAAILGGIAFFVLRALFPDLPFSEEQITAFALLIAAYVLGEGLDARQVAANFEALWKSWKFRTLLAGLILWAAQGFWPGFPLSQEQILQLIELIAALIVGLGLHDGRQ